jgi:hypothetical protein
MREYCHRCHGELPEPAAGSSRGDEETILFCPRCGAPQIRLPEHMRTDTPETHPATTTGALPPPRPAGVGVGPGHIEWRAAMRSMASVAVVAAALLLIGFGVGIGSSLCILWTISSGVIALGFYGRIRPRATVDARIGLRVGVATGLLVIAALAITLASVGAVLRFGTHRMAGFDAEAAQLFETFRLQMIDRMRDQNSPQDVQRGILNFMSSPEFRAGAGLFVLGFYGSLILLISAGGGAFAGMLRASRSPRPGLHRGN